MEGFDYTSRSESGSQSQMVSGSAIASVARSAKLMVPRMATTTEVVLRSKAIMYGTCPTALSLYSPYDPGQQTQFPRGIE